MLADHVASSVETGKVSTAQHSGQPPAKTAFSLLRGGGGGVSSIKAQSPSSLSAAKSLIDYKVVSLSRGEEHAASVVPLVGRSEEGAPQKDAPRRSTVVEAADSEAQHEAQARVEQGVVQLQQEGVAAYSTPGKFSFSAQSDSHLGVTLIAWSWLFVLIVGYAGLSVLRRWRNYRRPLEGRDVRL
jgi:hypothetical protein